MRGIRSLDNFESVRGQAFVAWYQESIKTVDARGGLVEAARVSSG
jgi:hypothetical protein